MELNIQNKEEFIEKIKQGKVLVDFYAVWCGPCNMLSPLIEKLCEDHPEILVIKINVDEAPEIAAQYNIYSIPTLLLFNDGELKKTQTGFLPEPSLKRFVGIE